MELKQSQEQITSVHKILCHDITYLIIGHKGNSILY